MPRISKKAAVQTGALFDRAANHAEKLARDGVISRELARKYALQCDMLSDHVARLAGLDATSLAKQALTGDDIVDEGTRGLDPEVIGEEVAGMAEGDDDEPYMDDQFTQQENRELRERQQAGDLGTTPVPEPQAPTPGRQAALASVQHLASALDTKLNQGRTASESLDLRRNMHRARLILKNTLRDASSASDPFLLRLGNACQHVQGAMTRASSADDLNKVARMLHLLEGMA